jgi:hypothetical protein
MVTTENIKANCRPSRPTCSGVFLVTTVSGPITDLSMKRATAPSAGAALGCAASHTALHSQCTLV